MKSKKPLVNQQELFQQAFFLHQSGQWLQAIALYQKLLKKLPKNPQILAELGTISLKQGHFDLAIGYFRHSLAALPNQANTLINFALALAKLQRFDEALQNYELAIALNPDHPLAHNNRGIALQQMQRYSEAIDSHNVAIAIKPDYADAYIHRGNAQQQLQQFEAALCSYQSAISLRPDYADAYCNGGNALKNLYRLPEALQHYNQALALKPNYAEAYFNRGCVFTELRQWELACVNFEQAISLKPDYAAAYWNKALVKLVTGNFIAGWQLYEWRWQDQQQEVVRKFKQPLWLGEQPITGKTLLIYPEQGLGDFIQFCRYAALVNDLGAKVVLEVPTALFSLISTLKGEITIINQGQTLPAFDLHCPMMSLPLAFKTTLDNITAYVPYLYVDVLKTQLWKERLGTKHRPRIGLVWSGSALHRNDAFRNIPFKLLEPLLLLDLEFHALQIQFRPEDECLLSNFTKLQIHQHQLSDFTDTAALANMMDLVITVDTSVAHLVGALGIPVWVLLAYTADFRWLLHRNDSPWYPTATLFRQTTSGDWSSVIADIVQKLSGLVPYLS